MAIPETRSLRQRIWAGRSLQFVFNGASGFVIPFLGLFYRESGLSGVEIGLLAALGAVIALLAAPTWGTLADRSRRPARVLQVALLGSALATFFLGRQTSFGGIALGTAAFYACIAGAWPLVDLVSFSQVRGTSAGFGTVRLGGSLGWMAMVIPAGLWIERTSLWSSFLGGSFAYAGAALVAGRFVEQISAETPIARGGGFFRTLRNTPPLALLAGALLVYGVGFTGPRQFMSIYVADLGGNEAFVGLVTGLGAFCEWPFMLLADRLAAMRRPGHVLRLGLMIFALGWAVAAVVPSAAWFAPARIITSAAFSFYIVGLVGTVSRRVRVEESGTAIGFFTITLPSLADLAGGPLSGWSYDLGTGRLVHAVAAIFSTASWMIVRRLPPADGPSDVDPPPAGEMP
jgi:PPP family 3-phenylpropionic acid transporter